MHKLGQDLGRFFEVGFNIGMLSYIQQKKMSHHFDDTYLKQLQKLNLTRMMPKIWRRERMIDEVDRQIVSRWVSYFMWRGFSAGLTFFTEYLQAVHAREIPEILYFQAQFYNENSQGTYSRDENEAFGELLAQLGVDKESAGRMVEGTYKKYKKKGEFLRADTLVLLAYRREYRILAVDLSIFFVHAMAELGDLNNPEVLRKLLSREINYLRSKSQFANLSLDTQVGETLSEDNATLFSQGLVRFYKAFIRQDKESAKLIQAASYAYSFYTFLKKIGKLDKQATQFNIVGYSDRGVSAMALGEAQIGLLRTCQQVYQQQPREQEIHEARKLVLETIKTQAARAFSDRKQGKVFLNRLLAHNYQDGMTSFSYQERLSGYVNSVDEVPADLLAPLGLPKSLSLRDGHAELITRALSPTCSALYLFLTGNPGIGKTTAIVNFLKQHIDEGFLFLYVSPRKQVNLDIIQKFKTKNGAICDNRLLLLNSTSDLIQTYGGRRHTVQYFSNSREGAFSSCGVKFVDGNADHDKNWAAQARLQRKTEVLIKESGAVNRGVLASVCEALHAVIHDNLAKSVVATVSIQSLRKTRGGNDTLMHLEKIFQDAYNKREGHVIDANLRAIAQRMKHLIIMVDEITGDPSGVAFLEGLRKFVKKMQLLPKKHGFNTKIIVADASIVDPEVISQHLSSTNPEQDKIFFRLSNASSFSARAQVSLPANVGGELEGGRALSSQPFRFKKQDAIIINANSYPAKYLDLTYKIFIETYRYNEQTTSSRPYQLEEKVQTQLIADILLLLQNPNSDQLIIYVQNKRVLGELIAEIGMIREQQKEPFVERQDYVQIHSNLSEEYKKSLEQYKNEVKLVFMTSSASRGLSFPNARHLLIAVPSFSIEQNLMEIIQVIYRGRGEEKMDQQGKDLTFYLAERAIYAAPHASPTIFDDDARGETQDASQISAIERQQAIQERILTLINIILILKTSIMTRIQGSGQIGRNQCLMVPVGGKSVSAIGETFSNRMSTLLKEVHQEYRKNQADIALLKIHKRIKTLLERSETRLHQAITTPEERKSSYLSLLNDFEGIFIRALKRGFDELLTIKPLQAAYTSGSLLIVPLATYHVDEAYAIRLWEQLIPTLNEKLTRQMWGIVGNKHYPDSLRTAMRQALELIHLLQDETRYRSQRFEQSSQRNDLYYAIPLFAFISHDALAAYYATNPQEPEKESFRNLLSSYIRTITHAHGILPIGQTYSHFPFLLFRSYSLEQMRQKRFTDKQLLTSNELNVLNLILSS